MHKALRAMGADVQEQPDGLILRKSRLHGARLDSRADHRMVMTLSLAGLAASGQTSISDIECVKKTFPSFVEQMSMLGCDMSKA
jgi:3-phosphoshikimate 1-carboxyvinyltransferase